MRSTIRWELPQLLHGDAQSTLHDNRQRCILFHGPPGTGKSYTANLFAAGFCYKQFPVTVIQPEIPDLFDIIAPAKRTCAKAEDIVSVAWRGIAYCNQCADSAAAASCISFIMVATN